MSLYRSLIAVGVIAIFVGGCGGQAAEVASRQPSIVVSAMPSAGAVIATEPATSEPTATSTPIPTAKPTFEATPAPTAKPTPKPTPEPTPKPVVYATLSDRSWQKVVKAPDSYTGRSYQIWACISQFDAATGLDMFRGQGSNKKREYWYTDGNNAMFSGDADQLADFVGNDIVSMKVTVLGSYSYDAQNGGNTTAPLFQVDAITRKGSCE